MEKKIESFIKLLDRLTPWLSAIFLFLTFRKSQKKEAENEVLKTEKEIEKVRDETREELKNHDDAGIIDLVLSGKLRSQRRKRDLRKPD